MNDLQKSVLTAIKPFCDGTAGANSDASEWSFVEGVTPNQIVRAVVAQMASMLPAGTPVSDAIKPFCDGTEGEESVGSWSFVEHPSVSPVAVANAIAERVAVADRRDRTREPLYYFFCDEVNVAGIAVMPAGLSSEGWGRIQRGFKETALSGVQDERMRALAHVTCYKLNRWARAEGVHWDEELIGAAGASYHILPGAPATPEAIEACIRHVRASFDVVSLTVREPSRWADDELATLIAHERSLMEAPALPEGVPAVIRKK